MFAFTILSIVSPVTYSIASLVKRIFVILASIIWFGDGVSRVQAFGITLTFVGLWMYDLAKENVSRSEEVVLMKHQEPLLPLKADYSTSRGTNPGIMLLQPAPLSSPKRSTIVTAVAAGGGVGTGIVLEPSFVHARTFSNNSNITGGSSSNNNHSSHLYINNGHSAAAAAASRMTSSVAVPHTHDRIQNNNSSSSSSSGKRD